jgi:hypothetical protein
VEDGCSVWGIRPSVTFCGHVEFSPCIFWEPGKEELEERVDVFAGDVTSTNPRPIVRVRPPDVHWLVEEQDVTVRIPGMLVPGYGPVLGGDPTRPKFE